MTPLLLSRIWLRNWHRFSDQVFDVDQGLYLAGHNGSGKSTLLDALQLVLIADIRRIKFNSSAQDSSERDLDGYVRGRRGDDDWLRPGATVAYVALEFCAGEAAQTIGICVEAWPGRGIERTSFILKEPLDPATFQRDGQPLTRRKLREALRDRRGARAYDNVQEYQAALREALGGINERFFDLLLRALHFKPLNNVNAFVEQWLLERRDLKLENLRAVRGRLQDLEVEAQRVEQRVARLDEIVSLQGEATRQIELRDTYALLAALFRAHAAAAELVEATARRDGLRDRLTQQLAAAETLATAVATFEAELDAAKQRLLLLDVVRRRDELRRFEREARERAERLQNDWDRLRADVIAQATRLTPALGQLAAEGPARAWVAATGGLGGAPPNAAYLERLVAAGDEIGPARDAATTELARVTDRVHELSLRVDDLEAELADLRRGVIRYPAPAVRLREALTAVTGERIWLLCELLEVTDPRWRDAAEALLGDRRFNLVVAPKHFDAAVETLDALRARGEVYGAGVIDLARAAREGRRAQPGSLAGFVRAQAEALQRYVDTAVGDVIAVGRVADLKRHRRAVTPEVVVYGEYVVRAIDPKRYREHYIGQAARERQIENRVRELGEARAELTQAAARQRDLKALQRLLSDIHTALAGLRERLDPPPDPRPARLDAESRAQELVALDLSGVAALEAEVAELDRGTRARRQAHSEALREAARFEEQTAQAERALSEARAAAETARLEAEAERLRLSPVAPQADELLAERVNRGAPPDEAVTARRKSAEFQTRADNVTAQLTELATVYNTTYQFAALPRLDETRYEAERERLIASELPRYLEDIARARTEAEQELREHVLHTLSEHIADARRKLNEINAALDGLPAFGRDRYRFTTTRADDTRDFYELITAGATQLGAGSLFESVFYRDHQEAFDKFYDALTRAPADEREAREQERLTDYRRYLTYDIVITDGDTGQQSTLSRSLGVKSGGETQTPFYVTIAASFVQLYRIQERSGRPTPRLVAFDEAFSKMDQDRIGATLDLFHHFGLQIVTATPLERCEYLVPKIRTSLVLTAIKDTVLVEPYTNYAARLNV